MAALCTSTLPLEGRSLVVACLFFYTGAAQWFGQEQTSITAIATDATLSLEMPNSKADFAEIV